MSDAVWHALQMVLERFAPPPPPTTTPTGTPTTSVAAAGDVVVEDEVSAAVSGDESHQQALPLASDNGLDTRLAPSVPSSSSSAWNSTSSTTTTTSSVSSASKTLEGSNSKSSTNIVTSAVSTTTPSPSPSLPSSLSNDPIGAVNTSTTHNAVPSVVSHPQQSAVPQSLGGGDAHNGSSATSPLHHQSQVSSASQSPSTTATTTNTTSNEQARQPEPDEQAGQGGGPYSLTMNLTFNIRAHPHPPVNHHHHHRRIALPFPRWLLRPAIFMDEATALAVDLATGGRAVGAAAAAAGLDIPEALHARTRHRLYSILLLRAAMAYFLMVPHIFRRVLEYTVLAAAILSLALLIHLHVIFIRSPLTCLDDVKDNWPRDGILRVQIGSYLDHSDISSNENGLFPNLTGLTADVYRGPFPLTLKQYRLGVVGKALTSKEKFDQLPAGYFGFLLRSYNYSSPNDFVDSLRSQHEFYYRNSGARPQPYMVEYSLEYGLLRLSDQMRSHYKVPVMTVTLCPDKDVCFGDPFARFMLRNFLGYDDVLIGSIKRLAESENNRGYVRNVATGEHFRFVNVWMTRASYLAAGFIMIVFTLFLSMLIRYTHHLIFVCISEFLRSVELQLPFSRSPATRFVASLITTILAFIGMEAIMYEFFADSSIAFHLIIMVWAADQFDSMAIRSRISKRYFLRFFYLYQFAFYAYHYRFNGQYAGLAMLTTMLFTYHAMIFFFHHYELPYVQVMEQVLIRRAMGGGVGGGGGPPGGGAVPAEDEVIAHNNNNNNNNNDVNQDEHPEADEGNDAPNNAPSSQSRQSESESSSSVANGTVSAGNTTSATASLSNPLANPSILMNPGRTYSRASFSAGIHPTESSEENQQQQQPHSVPLARSLMEYEID